MQVRKQQLELDMEQQTGSKYEKDYVKAVYCHPAYLTSMQSTSWETLGWKKHKLESRLPGEPHEQYQKAKRYDTERWASPGQKVKAGIKTSGSHINNLWYADDTPLMAESKEEPKSLLMKVKEKSEKKWLKTQHL